MFVTRRICRTTIHTRERGKRSVGPIVIKKVGGGVRKREREEDRGGGQRLSLLVVRATILLLLLLVVVMLLLLGVVHAAIRVLGIIHHPQRLVTLSRHRHRVMLKLHRAEVRDRPVRRRRRRHVARDQSRGGRHCRCSFREVLLLVASRAV